MAYMLLLQASALQDITACYASCKPSHMVGVYQSQHGLTACQHCHMSMLQLWTSGMAGVWCLYIFWLFVFTHLRRASTPSQSCGVLILQEASQQVRELQKQNKALVAELERLQRVKDARIAQLEQASLICCCICLMSLSSPFPYNLEQCGTIDCYVLHPLRAAYKAKLSAFCWALRLDRLPVSGLTVS